MAAKKKKYKHPTKWLHSIVPIKHGLTQAGATKVCNLLIKQKYREGYTAKLVKGRLKFNKRAKHKGSR